MNSIEFNAGLYRKFFVTALREARERQAAYDAEVEEWYTEEGQRYRFPRCQHGTSLWVDYDCVCWQCEEGTTPLNEAQEVARERYAEFSEALNWFCSIPKDVPPSLRKSVGDYVSSLAKYDY